MLASTSHSSQLKSNPVGFLPRTNFDDGPANRVVHADFARDARLLDASIAGVILSVNPRDDEMREKAAHAWQFIRAMLADHLLDNAKTDLPWVGDASPTACELLKKRYSELRSLARTIDSTSFASGKDPDISAAGKALCRLAVKLDDLGERTQRRLVNKLRQYVFAAAKERSLAA